MYEDAVHFRLPENPFDTSRLKVERANKHVQELKTLLESFFKSDFYSVSIEHDTYYRTNHLCVQITNDSLLCQCALIIGDCLHNLRSALDILYMEVIESCQGKTTQWTRFPIRDTRDELVAPLKNALDKKQITNAIFDFIIDTVQPYETGNNALWVLDAMNVMDKHQLLIPVFQLMAINDISLEDEKGTIHGPLNYYTEGSFRQRLRLFDDVILNVKDKGHAAGTIVFQLGTFSDGQPVIPTLSRIAEEVLRTVEAFSRIA